MMRFALGMFAAAGLLLVASVCPRPIAGVANAPSSPATTSPSFVGSWTTAIVPASGTTVPTLATYGSDGTLIVSRPPVTPAPPGAAYRLIFASTGHGIWVATGHRTAVIAFVLSLSDDQGHLLGSQSVRGTDDLAPDGQSFRGIGTVTFADPAGGVLSTSTVNVQGRRISIASQSGGETLAKSSDG